MKADNQANTKGPSRAKVAVILGFAAVVAIVIVALRSTKEQGGASAPGEPAVASVALAPPAPTAPQAVQSRPLDPPAPAPAPSAGPPVDCKTCESQRCDSSIAGCESLSGEDQTRCRALLACVHATHCASGGAPEPCLCGTASMDECLTGKGNGPCRKELEKAAQPSSTETAARVQQIAERYYNSAFAVGRAMNLVVCDINDCAGSCKL
jgi:hypothetical protein